MGKKIEVILGCEECESKTCGGCEFSGEVMKQTGAWGICELSGGKIMDDDTCDDFCCAECGYAKEDVK